MNSCLSRSASLSSLQKISVPLVGLLRPRFFHIKPNALISLVALTVNTMAPFSSRISRSVVSGGRAPKVTTVRTGGSSSETDTETTDGELSKAISPT